MRSHTIIVKEHAWNSIRPPPQAGKVAVSVNAVNSVHGRHFVLVTDGRLRDSDKIVVQGEGEW